jgi:hypothetical protein
MGSAAKASKSRPHPAKIRGLWGCQAIDRPAADLNEPIELTSTKQLNT